MFVIAPLTAQSELQLHSFIRWNNRLSHIVGNPYPSFARFMRTLKQEQKHTETWIAQALAGKIKANVSRKAESRQKALQVLANDYENRFTLDYLRGCSYNVEVSEGMVTPVIDDEEDEVTFPNIPV